jgi:hypothetical protein
MRVPGRRRRRCRRFGIPPSLREGWGTYGFGSIGGVSASTNEWQRVDNQGCVPAVLRISLLCWAIVLPYAVITGNKGWFAFSLACVLTGVWWTLRNRAQGAFFTAGMGVSVVPPVLRPHESCLVTLRIEDDAAKSVRWWRAELLAEVPGDEPKVVVTAEFAIDPAAGNAPVAELQMVLTLPGESTIGDVEAQAWFVQATVETERGRMESGRVRVEITST